MARFGVEILGTFVQAGVLGLWLVAAVLVLRPGARWRAGLLLVALVQFLAPGLFTLPVREATVTAALGPAGAPGTVDLLTMVGAARLVGVVVGLGLLLRAVTALRRTLAAPATERVEAGPIHDVLRDVAAGQGVATPRLFLTESAGPGTVGIRRPAVLLPRPLVDALDPNALRLVLAHEVAHVARRDPLMAVARGVVLALWWFHPVAWIAARMHRAAAEDVCDDVAAERAGADAYCGALLASARVATAAPPAGLSAALGGHPLGRRFRRLLDAERRAREGLLDRIAERVGPDAAAGLLVAIAAAALIAAPIRFVAFERPGDDVVRAERIVDVRAERIVNVRTRTIVR